MRLQILLWDALRKNISLILVWIAVACPVLAVGQAIRGVTWSLMMPVALAAVLCGWWIGRSRLNGRQAAGWSVALGVVGVFIYVAKLIVPLWNFLISVYSIIFQGIRWLDDRSPVDPTFFVTAIQPRGNCRPAPGGVAVLGSQWQPHSGFRRRGPGPVPSFLVGWGLGWLAVSKKGLDHPCVSACWHCPYNCVELHQG